MASGAQLSLRERPIQFGKYTLLARIAGGGMGELFLAQLRSAGGFQKLVVIKRILSHLTDKAEFVDMFVAEARTAARITHPNVCQIYELGQVDGRYYMALEYLEGLPLADVMVARKRHPQLADLRLLASLMAQTAEGLHHAHTLRDPDGESAHVVHRDVNPRNVFVTSAGVAKLLDFGIVKVRGALSQVQTDSVRGTYSYMAPEQLQGEAVDCTADIFSLGTITWEAVVGRRLFKRGSDFLTWRAIVEEPIPRASQFRSDLPPELDDALMRALARSAAERYQSAREFAAAVEQAIRPLGAPLTTLAIAEEMEKAFAPELAAQRERVFAAHRRQEADRPGAEPIADWDGLGSDTRVADPGYTELATRMASPRPLQAGVPSEPLLDVSSEGLELSEPTAPLAPAAAISLPLPAPVEHVEEDAQAATIPRLSRLLPPPPASIPDEDEDEDEGDDLLPMRRRRRWAIGLALALSAATGAAIVLLLNRDSATEEAGEIAAGRVQTEAGAPAMGAKSAPDVSAAANAGASQSQPPARDTTQMGSSAPDRKTDARPGAAPAPNTAAAPVPSAPMASETSPRTQAGADPVAPAGTEPDRGRPAGQDREGDRQDKARDGKRARRSARSMAASGPASTGKENGFLTINAEPYATLYVDGKKYGYTPMVRISLMPGPHRLRLVSSGGQPEKNLRVRIVPGQELRKFITW